ncbi:MAG: hypothetical protein COU47_02640 [Candidatus Niyogibacteria bacterium CG10_big_fil_rev_8_21_14_0_10_46_36]|uniref:Bacterial sugar transferase domain-containing protein n=1 Tax=Candidatus Niyogibacteria bacterium CG10_big_fil_rev_8_21_14_0_10_46_36 TaxID=1974726 RepID=A0A2H0TD21_9BACT|nr:MAG: hypothetical protein COU47_02640 [Candidatus Niyogibacteria bacterium CG10_big_fil_rev_8_21_14_0_10_46_36]
MKRIPFLSFVLFLGDILLFYGALALTLFLRYQGDSFAAHWELHKAPFTILLILWLFVFYIGGLYERKSLKATAALQEKIIRNIIAGGIIGAFLFYLIPYFGIAPKTNLLIHIILVTLFLSAWRSIIARYLATSLRTKILFFGASSDALDMMEYLNANPQLGFEPAGVMTTNEKILSLQSVKTFSFDNHLTDIIQREKINLVVASADIKQNEAVVRMLYQVLPLGISFMDFPAFYEFITGKIPTSLINEAWFLENLAQLKNNFNDVIKRALDVVLALIGTALTILLFPFIALAIKVTSPGPILIRQVRIGKNKKEFTLVKFRSMIALSKDGLAEKEGSPIWAEHKDPRITRIGNFLRKTHLDELPQVWNILKNDISVVGPRPERPEIVTRLEDMIPHYTMRHLIKPGVTGWAQINMPQMYAGSVEETLEKLQYDLYYIKHQSPVIDISIILKTILLTLTRRGR